MIRFLFGQSYSRTTKILLVLLAAAVAQAGFLVHQKASAPRSIQIGDALPPLTLEQRGVPLRLHASELSACTHVVFFSPSCATSVRSAPAWSSRFADGRHRVVGVSYADWDETLEFAAAHDLRFPILATGAARVGEIATRTGVLAFPRVLVLGKNGRVAAIGDSRTDLAELVEVAGCTLEEPP